MEQNPKTMTQAELRSYLRDRKNNNEISFTNPDSEKHWTPFVNGQLAGFGVDALRIVAQTWMFPPEGYVLPSAGDPQPEPERKPLVRKKDKPAISREDLIEILTGSSGDELDEEEVRRIVNQQIDERIGDGLPEKRFIVTPVETIPLDDELYHSAYPGIYRKLKAKRNVWGVGPAGSGKSNMGKQLAKALGLPFYFTGKIDSESKLMGFIDGGGVFRSKPFFKAFTEGGLFMFDEFDASDPRAVTAFNTALSNRMCDFPTGCFEQHPDFRVIAFSNTWGNGATRDYVGRNQMSGEAKDRFVFVPIDYDKKLELAVAKQYEGGAEVARRVHKIRKAIAKLKLRHIVSIRGIVDTAVLLLAGDTEEQAWSASVWKDMKPEDRAKVEAEIGGAE